MNFNKPKKIIALTNKNVNELKNSTSGGAFVVLAKPIIDEGGVVFGCVMNNDGSCFHKSAKSYENLKSMQGSKYVRSNINNTFNECYKFLKKNRKVLFSGTPCQINALNSYLRTNKINHKIYDNLITVDIFCAGTPSQKLFKLYIKWICSKFPSNSTLINYKFRSKIKGWSNSIVSYSYMHKDKLYSKWKYSWEDPYNNAYINNKIMMKQCYKCIYKCFNRCSDFSIGDYWGIENSHPEFFNKYKDYGISAVLINTDKALKYFYKHVAENTYYINSSYKKVEQPSLTGCNNINNISINSNLNNYVKEDNYMKIFDSLFKIKKYTLYLKKLKLFISHYLHSR